MQNLLDRRRFIAGVGVSALGSSALMPLAEANPKENSAMNVINHQHFRADREIDPELVRLSGDLDAALLERAAAIEAKEWTVAEWRHLWPLAPEEILGGANAHKWHSNHRQDIERDLAGSIVMRETAELTKRLAKKFRRECGKTAFFVTSAEEAARRLERWRAHQPVGRTAKSRAQNMRQRDRFIREGEAKLAAARKYEAETARIRKASGIEAAGKRIDIALARIVATMQDIANHPATGAEAARIKAKSIEKWLSVFGRSDVELDAILTAKWTSGVIAALTA